MPRFIEQQAVIDCLNNTAKYYEREDSDEWTRGMRYGLLHGVDSILDNVSPVEAIPKDQYEARLKADLEAMLTDVQIQIEEVEKLTNTIGWELRAKTPEEIKKECSEIIQQKIDKLKGGEMTHKENLEQRTKEINNKGGASLQDWELLLLTSIADSLAVIADCLTEKEAKDADN